MIIILTLVVLILLTFISVIFGNEFIGIPLEQELDFQVIVNGSVSTVKIEGETMLFNIDPILGTIAIIIAIGVFSGLIGVRILGSGISETSVRIISIGVVHTGLWLMLSILAMPLIISIEVFGTIIYIALTLGYTIGVIQKISEG